MGVLLFSIFMDVEIMIHRLKGYNHFLYNTMTNSTTGKYRSVGVIFHLNDTYTSYT